jgi:aerobic carbon-monoxide dehydrogenase medium subunit
MFPQTFEYTAPKTLDEAMKLLAGGAKPLAGGMILIPMMKLRLAIPEHLVDLGRIKDLSYIREERGHLHIGATTTHYAVESSPLVRAKCPLLAAAAGSIGDVQVRNMGTVGGSIAHNDPSADYPAALQALEAKIVIRGAKGDRTVPADDFLVDAFTTTLEPGEIVRELIVPIEAPGVGASYQKAPQPASGFAMVGVAVRVQKTGDKVTLARIGVTGLSNRAYRADAAEKALTGTAGSAADVQAAAALVVQGIDANADIFASADYRKHLASVYAERALNAALGG